MYKYGIRDRSLKMDWQEAIEAAGKIGFEGIEIVVREEELDLLMNSAGREEVLGWTRAAGIQISSLSVAAFRLYKSAEGDPTVRAEAMEIVDKALRVAKSLNCAGILLPYFDRENIDVDDDEEGRLIEDFRRISPVAEEMGIYVCFETSFSSAQLKRICDGVGSDWVGVYQDFANALSYGHDSVEILTSLPGETKMIHAKDTNQSMLGDGDVDFPACRQAVRDIGYEGWLVFETPSGDDPVAAAKLNLAFAKAAFD